MPITDIQARVLQLISKNRNPESYVAGATLIHREAHSPRYSQDLDIFHDLAESVAGSAETDARTLIDAGHTFAWLLRTPTFHRALVTVSGESLRMEWAQDSAFRFFPLVVDERFGYSLHPADAAVNKLLALAGRSEIRDFVDVLFLHDTYLSLGATAWAGCGKDPGFTPEFLLDQAARHTAYGQQDLDRLRLQSPIDLRDLKAKWLTALEEARNLIRTLPADALGCLYLDASGIPRSPYPASPHFGTLMRHTGSIRGAWPTLSNSPVNDQV